MCGAITGMISLLHIDQLRHMYKYTHTNIYSYTYLWYITSDPHNESVFFQSRAHKIWIKEYGPTVAHTSLQSPLIKKIMPKNDYGQSSTTFHLKKVFYEIYIW